MNNGWIKLHRSIIEWEWYSDIKVFRLFIHCLVMANHADKKYKGNLIKKGSFVTGLHLLSEQTGLSMQSVRTSLNKLKLTNELTIKSNTKGTIIQVVNYDKYQQVTNEITNQQQTNNKRITTNKNIKNEKNIIPPTFEMVLKYKDERKSSIDVNRFINFYEAKNWYIGKNKMKDWQAAFRTWEKPNNNRPTGQLEI